MYVPISSNEIYQGDIISNFSFIVSPLGEPITIQTDAGNLKQIQLSKIQHPYKEGKETLLVNSFLADGMIVSQTCDIQRRKYISICPVHRLTKIIKDLTNDGWVEKQIKNFVDTLRKQNVNYYFFLPQGIVDGTSIEESYVDLQMINSFPTANIERYARVLALSDKGRHWLDFKLISLFGRPF